MEHNGPLVLQSGAASSHCHWAIWLSPFPSSPLSPSTFYLILDFVHSHGLAWSKSRRKRGKREVLHYALCCGQGSTQKCPFITVVAVTPHLWCESSGSGAMRLRHVTHVPTVAFREFSLKKISTTKKALVAH